MEIYTRLPLEFTSINLKDKFKIYPLWGAQLYEFHCSALALLYIHQKSSQPVFFYSDGPIAFNYSPGPRVPAFKLTGSSG